MILCKNCGHEVIDCGGHYLHAGEINLGTPEKPHFVKSALQKCPVEACACIYPNTEVKKP